MRITALVSFWRQCVETNRKSMNVSIFSLYRQKYIINNILLTIVLIIEINSNSISLICNNKIK